MAKQIQFEGVTHQFPDDATDDEIRSALEVAHPKAPEPSQGNQRGFWQSLWDKTGGAVVPALKEWYNRPDALPDAMAAHQALEQAAMRNPANKGKAPGKWEQTKETELTPDEQAVVNKGLSGMRPLEGNILQEATGPAVEAGGQAAAGNLKGAAGTLVGGYVAPAALGAIIPEIPGAIESVKNVATRPGVPRIVAGAGEVLGGGALAAHGHPIIGAGAVLGGGRTIAQGVREFTAPVDATQSLLKSIRKGASQPETLYQPRPIEPSSVPPPASPVPVSRETLESPPEPQGAPTAQQIGSLPASEASKLLNGSLRRGKGMTQSVKDAGKMVDKLVEWDFTPDEAKSMADASWNKLAFDSGVPAQFTKAMKERVIFGLQKKLAGPPVSLETVMERLKASLPKE